MSTISSAERIAKAEEWIRQRLAELCHTDESIRTATIKVLREWNQPVVNQMFANRLVTAIQGEVSSDYRPAVASLADLGELALSSIRAGLFDCPSPIIHARLLEALAAVGFTLSQPRRAVVNGELVIELWGGDHEEILLVVGRALAKFRDLDQAEQSAAAAARHCPLLKPPKRRRRRRLDELPVVKDVTPTPCVRPPAVRLCPELTAELSQLMSDLTEHDQLSAQEVIAQFRQNAVPDLIPILADRLVEIVERSDEPRRHKAMLALAELGEAALTSIEIGLMCSSENDVQVRLLEAMGIVGQHLGPVKRSYIDWYLSLELWRGKDEAMRRVAARQLAALRKKAATGKDSSAPAPIGVGCPEHQALLFDGIAAGIQVGTGLDCQQPVSGS